MVSPIPRPVSLTLGGLGLGADPNENRSAIRDGEPLTPPASLRPINETDDEETKIHLLIGTVSPLTPPVSLKVPCAPT